MGTAKPARNTATLRASCPATGRAELASQARLLAPGRHRPPREW